VPKDLAALLVENGAVPADVVERAVARQQAAGGTLDTALLELGVPEDDLASWLARAAELPAAPASAWTASDPRARRVFPSRVAERHGLAPFALDGRELSLVATYPVDLGLLDEISFMLSLHLTAHVGPEWRVRELIHRIYGSALAPRLAALAGLPGGAPAAPGSAQPPASPDPQGAAPELVRAEVVADVEPESAPAPEQRRPPPSAAALAGFAAGDEPMEPLAAALAEALESVDFSDFEEAPAAEDGGTDRVAEAPAQAEAEAPVEEEPPAPPDRTAPPHWSLEDARAALAAASHRDELVLAALRYARDFFEFVAMFAVTRDAVAGHDGLGIEEARERVRAVAIWANDPGVFRTVIETQSPYLGPAQAGAAGTDAVLHGLGRTPRTVLVYPILLRDRPICILYADNGEAPVSPRRLGDLLLFLSTVGPAFERIIRDRKKRRRRRTTPPPATTATVAEAPPPAPEPVHEQAAAPPPEPAAPPQAALAPPSPPAEVAPPPAPETPSEAAPPEPAQAATPAEAPEPAQAPEAPEPPPSADAAAPAAGDDAEGELSFAILEEQGYAEPAPAPAPAPPPAAQQADPGRTAILWPPPAASSEAPSDPWDAAQQAVKAEAAAARPAEAGSLAALEDRFFAEGGGTPAPVAETPESPARPEPVTVPAAAAPPAVPVAAPSPPPAGSTPPTPEAPPAAEAPAPEAAPRQRPAAPRGPPPRAAPPDPASLTALADRALDADPEVAAAACAALGNRRRDPAIRPAAEKLRRALLSGIAARATRAARGIGELRDLDSIPLLIQALETSEPETAKAASDALAAITLQRHGPDARRWLAWWKENRGRGRAEWLFSALSSPDRELRVAASLELSHAAPPPVAYTADMPPSEREKAARAWAGWWARSGHVL
jgi:hypothetical protein